MSNRIVTAFAPATVSNVACAPQPYQGKLPPIRIAASTPDTFPAIGALGYPVSAVAERFPGSLNAAVVRTRERFGLNVITLGRSAVRAFARG